MIDGGNGAETEISGQQTGCESGDEKVLTLLLDVDHKVGRSFGSKVPYRNSANPKRGFNG